MAGHSHSSNIKHRKDRQDIVRSQKFLKLRRRIEETIKKEGQISEQLLSLAQKNHFPKYKVYQIYEQLNKKNASFSSDKAVLFLSPFSIYVYLEDNEIDQETIKYLKMKKLPLSLVTNYFQMIYCLKLQSLDDRQNILEQLISILPIDWWNNINYDEKTNELFSVAKEIIQKIENLLNTEPKLLIIKEKRNIWKPLVINELTSKEELEYYNSLEKFLLGKKFYTNVTFK